MPNQKLLEVLRCLSESESRKLRLFIDSPYHNDGFNKIKIAQLCKRLLDDSPQPDEIFSSKLALSKTFFPNHMYKEKEKNPIDSLASDLLSVVRRFILLEDVLSGQDKRHERLAMARFYRRNNMENRFLAAVVQFRKYQSKADYQDKYYYDLQFEMEEEIAVFQSIYNTWVDDSNLIAANQALDNYYAIRKSEYATHLRFQESLANIESEESFLLSDHLFSVLPTYQELHNPLTLLYNIIFKLLGQPEHEALFEDLSQAVIRYEKEIPPGAFRNIMAYFRNISGRRYQLRISGNELYEQLFPLYREHLEKGYFYVQDTDQVLPGSLKVLVNLAIKAKETDWALELLEKHTPEYITGTKFPVEAHSLCLAEVYFHKKELQKAQESLVYRNFENINYSILADVLLIKIYFVTKDELLNSRTAALSQKVRRSKITREYKQQYLNFLKLLGQIEKLRWKGTVKTKKRIQQRLEEVSPIIERTWLIEMLAL